MKKNLLLALLLSVAASTFAEDVVIGNIYYRLNGAKQIARVMPSPDKSYSGTVNIPPSVTKDGVTYRVTSIGSNAFENCEGLTAVTLPSTLDSIFGRAFRMTQISSFVLPAGTVFFVEDALIENSKLTSLSVAQGNPRYDSRNNCNAIIMTENNMLVASCRTTVIPNTVKLIGTSAFYGFSGTEMVVPEGVESIGHNAFANSPALTKLTLPSTLTYIGNNLLQYCTSMEKVVCNAVTPPSVGGIASYTIMQFIDLFVPAESVNAYRNNSEWRKFNNVLTLEDDVPLPPEEFPTGMCGENLSYTIELMAESEDRINVEENGRNVWRKPVKIIITGTGAMFDYDSWWTTPWTSTYRYRVYAVELPDGLTRVGDNAFGGMTGLMSIELPTSCTSVGKEAFYNCRLQNDLHLHEGLTSIGDRAFSALMNTRNLYLPASLTHIGEAGVAGIQQQENFYLNEANPNYILVDNALIEKATNILIGGNKNTIIPSTVTAIGPKVFESNRMETMLIPEGIVSIGEDAFFSSDIKYITIPNSVTTIADKAFISCRYLQRVTLGSGLTYIGKQCFQNDTKITDVYSYADPTKLTWETNSVGFIYGKKTLMHVHEADLEAWGACFPNANVTFVGDLGGSTRPITEVTSVDVDDLKGKGLADTTIDNVYYNLDTNNGNRYDETRHCLVIGQTTDMSLIGDGMPGSDEVRENFNGIIMQVGPGKGVITINVLTSGWAQLAVRIGNGEPTYAIQSAGGRVLISYEVAEETYVYIYSVKRGSLARIQEAEGEGEEEEDALLIYGINIMPGYHTTTGIAELVNTENDASAKLTPVDAPLYSLTGTPVATPRQKGVYVRNGRKVVIK